MFSKHAYRWWKCSCKSHFNVSVLGKCCETERAGQVISVSLVTGKGQAQIVKCQHVASLSGKYGHGKKRVSACCQRVQPCTSAFGMKSSGPRNVSLGLDLFLVGFDGFYTFAESLVHAYTSLFIGARFLCVFEALDHARDMMEFLEVQKIGFLSECCSVASWCINLCQTWNQVDKSPAMNGYQLRALARGMFGSPGPMCSAPCEGFVCRLRTARPLKASRLIVNKFFQGVVIKWFHYKSILYSIFTVVI